MARNAAKWLPSSLASVRSSCDTAAPETRGIGGSESRSKHIAGRAYKGGARSAAYPANVTEESQRDEMNAAIRAQRERGAVPKSMLPPEEEPPPARPDPPAPAPAAKPEPPKQGLLARLFKS